MFLTQHGLGPEFDPHHVKAKQRNANKTKNTGAEEPGEMKTKLPRALLFIVKYLSSTRLNSYIDNAMHLQKSLHLQAVLNQ